MGGNRFRRLRRTTARIGLFTGQILLGMLLSDRLLLPARQATPLGEPFSSRIPRVRFREKVRNATRYGAAVQFLKMAGQVFRKVKL
jgi:hypothetical protein